MALVLCFLSLAGCFFLRSLSLTAGLGGLITVGYLYGILRANAIGTFSHFIFDCAVIGFYANHFTRPSQARAGIEAGITRTWVTALLAWPAIMFMLPQQPVLIRLVGLRGNAFLIPFILVGARLRSMDCQRLALWLAALNLMAISFGVSEYFLGLERFYPRNANTILIYQSKISDDSSGDSRIPACFANAHSYGGTMVMTLPWLLGAWVQPRIPTARRYLIGAGIAAGMLGVFLCAARVQAVLLFVLLAVASFSPQLRGTLWLGWSLMLAGIARLVSSQERMQRFMTLLDTDLVVERVHTSVNMTFFQLLLRYPLGNGLGGGGTSIPHFLQYLIDTPVGVENEYGRIMLEQGWVGLALWLAFAAWGFSRPAPPPWDPWILGWRLLWFACLGQFGLAVLGIGMMTAIPQTCLLFMSMGFLTAHEPEPDVAWDPELEASEDLAEVGAWGDDD